MELALETQTIDQGEQQGTLITGEAPRIVSYRVNQVLMKHKIIVYFNDAIHTMFPLAKVHGCIVQSTK